MPIRIGKHQIGASKVVAAAVAGAIAVSAGGTVLSRTGGGGGGGGGLQLANLWVDTNGGTCARSATLVAYSDAAACSSFDAAYGAATLGDLVLVKGGTYPAQVVLERAAKAATTDQPDVVFDHAGAEVVLLGDLDLGSCSNTSANGCIDGPDHITMRNFSSVPIASASPNAYWEIDGDSHDITWTNMSAPSFFIDYATEVTIDGGSWGPCTTTGNVAVDKCGNNHVNGQSAVNVTIKNATFHDYVIQPGSGAHFECMIIFAPITNVTLSNNKFHDCAVYDVFVQQSLGNSVSGLTMENNWFGQPMGEGTANYTEVRAVAFSPKAVPFTNVLLRFNSFQDNAGFQPNDDGDATVYSNFRVTGNVLGTNSCYASVTWLYNAYDGTGTCSGTGEVALNRSLPYANNSNGSSQDYHLSGATTGIDNLVPTSVTDGCPAQDTDGQGRPAGTNCDAGSDER